MPVFRTRQNGAAVINTSTVQLGQLLFGASYRWSASRTVNVSLGTGVTQEAPDVLRVPFAF
ncbi:MAG: hypothetical protein ACT4P4_09675 [Betaproteobacteria bacterium]